MSFFRTLSCREPDSCNALPSRADPDRPAPDRSPGKSSRCFLPSRGAVHGLRVPIGGAKRHIGRIDENPNIVLKISSRQDPGRYQRFSSLARAVRQFRDRLPCFSIAYARSEHWRNYVGYGYLPPRSISLPFPIPDGTQDGLRALQPHILAAAVRTITRIAAGRLAGGSLAPGRSGGFSRSRVVEPLSGLLGPRGKATDVVAGDRLRVNGGIVKKFPFRRPSSW